MVQRRKVSAFLLCSKFFFLIGYVVLLFSGLLNLVKLTAERGLMNCLFSVSWVIKTSLQKAHSYRGYFGNDSTVFFESYSCILR